jgi:glycerophosphoryl diester phosphodiesterase
MHDSTVNRTTNGVGSVASLSLATIQGLDAGSWFSPQFAGEPVPTLVEAISAALSVGLTPLVERKDGPAALYHSEFSQLGVAPSSLRIISFDWDFLGALSAIDPTYHLGALGSGALSQATINSLLTRGVDFVDWSHASVNQATVDLVHGNGMELHAWTVDSATRMQELIDLGVDGITTNVPATLRSLLDDAGVSADLNGDGFVNAADWRLYNAGRGADLSGLTREQSYAYGDLDGDRDNDITDFVTFKQLFEMANGPGSLSLITTVPEPSSIATALVGLLLLSRNQRTT